MNIMCGCNRLYLLSFHVTCCQTGAGIIMDGCWIMHKLMAIIALLSLDGLRIGLPGKALGRYATCLPHTNAAGEI